MGFWTGAGAFVAPGGGPPWDVHRLSDGVWEVSGAGLARGPAPVPGRWCAAQEAERAFWAAWRSNALYGGLSLEAYWRGVLEKSGGAPPAGRLLDVGCGPVTAFNFFSWEGVMVVGVDPLAEFYHERGLVESAPGLAPIPVAACAAERLPFSDASMDHAACFNVLDHVADPGAVLGEVWRVLKPGCSARVFVHAFSPWVRHLLFFDRPHVRHWSRGAFARFARRAGFRVRELAAERKAFSVPEGLANKIKYLPYVAASRFTTTAYYTLERA